MASAGVPMRRPEVTIGGRGSNGTALRFTVMPTSCSRSSACWPSSSRVAQVDEHQVHVGAAGEHGDARRGDVRRGEPLGEDRRAVERALLAVLELLACAATLNATALAAITCMSGPPCWPGKTAESIFLAYSSRLRMKPERGPPSVLCIVEETTSACGTGLGCRPAATRPAKCAMSTQSLAPTSSAIDAEGREVEVARVGRPAGDDHVGTLLERLARAPRPCRRGTSPGRRRRRRRRRACRRS